MKHASPKDPLLARIIPEKKVAAGVAAGAAVTLIIWAASMAGIDMPEPVAAAAVTLVSFVAAWLAPHTRRSDAP